MKKTLILFLLCTLENSLSADVPIYRLLPGDGYVPPKATEVQLKWTALPLQDIPAEIVEDMGKPDFPGQKRDGINRNKEISAAKIDLNFDGVPEWIVEDHQDRGNGGGEYVCYQCDAVGKFHRIGKFYGGINSILEPQNGYYQLEFSGRDGMTAAWFSIFAFDPKKQKYASVRSEWYDYNNFTCKVDGLIPGEHPQEWLSARLETALRLAVKKNFANEITQDDIKFRDNGFYYPKDGREFLLCIAPSGRRYKLGVGNFAQEYPLESFGLKNQSVYMTGKKKYSVLWWEITAWLNERMPVWGSAWFKQLPPNNTGIYRNDPGIYLGTLHANDPVNFPQAHPFINYVMTDVIDLATGVQLSHNIFLSLKKADLSAVKSGERVAVYSKYNPIRQYIWHVKQWIRFDELKGGNGK